MKTHLSSMETLVAVRPEESCRMGMAFTREWVMAASHFSLATNLCKS